MHIIRQCEWALADRLVTPEPIFLNRRQLLAGAGFLGLGAGLERLRLQSRQARQDRRLTPRRASGLCRCRTAGDAGSAQHDLQQFLRILDQQADLRLAEQLKTRPWDIAIDGAVEKPFTIGFEDS